MEALKSKIHPSQQEQNQIAKAVIAHFTAEEELTKLVLNDDQKRVECKVVIHLINNGFSLKKDDINRIMTSIAFERNWAIAEQALKELKKIRATNIIITDNIIQHLSTTYLTNFNHRLTENTTKEVKEILKMLWEEITTDTDTEVTEALQKEITNVQHAIDLIARTDAPLLNNENAYTKWVRTTLRTHRIQIGTKQIKRLTRSVVERRVIKATKQIQAILACPELAVRTTINAKINHVLKKYKLYDSEGIMRKTINASLSSNEPNTPKSRGGNPSQNNHSGGRSGSRSAVGVLSSRTRSNGTGRYSR